MIVRIFIEPGERADAMEAYGDWLTPDQIDTIMNAPESACIALIMQSLDSVRTCNLTVIEEG
jgi:hypothetical protein